MDTNGIKMKRENNQVAKLMRSILCPKPIVRIQMNEYENHHIGINIAMQLNLHMLVKTFTHIANIFQPPIFSTVNIIKMVR
jgi:hypothetical protein